MNIVKIDKLTYAISDISISEDIKAKYNIEIDPKNNKSNRKRISNIIEY